MRAIVQRVSEARVSENGETLGAIGPGLCIFLGVGKTDDENSALQLAHKVENLRIFEDSQGKMNYSVTNRRGELLVISQFTLYGDCRKGNRPSFIGAAAGPRAEQLYQYFVDHLRSAGLIVATGRFQARMEVSLVNEGPATFYLES